ncbi:hypothetical protein CSV73_09545 [Sporosarcina sp. P1]|nr:hypothetical protein CSV73_09545 [Sporosarcina sp. P1]
MKNQLLRMVAYSFIMLSLLFSGRLNFFVLAIAYSVFTFLELFFYEKGYFIENKYVKKIYKVIFIFTAILIIFNREHII